MAQKKDTAVSIASRREMATLLDSSREASARIRVENIIQTDICVELMEILELYAELLLARAGLLDARDKAVKDGSLAGGDDLASGLEEAAASIIYAAPRLPREVRELGVVRGMLVERFGKEFAQRAQENRDEIVPKRVTEKLKVEPPKEVLVTAYLAEIARTYGVEWPRRREGEEEEMEGLGREVDDEGGSHADGDDDGEGGGGKEMPIAVDTGAQTQTPVKKNRVDLGQAFDREQLSRATPPRDIGPGGAKSPVSVAPPGPRSDNLSPKVKLPDGKAATAAPKPQSKNVVGGAVPTVDDLAKRVSALKR
jgi:vacuolar protein sorting-associated protein IST1